MKKSKNVIVIASILLCILVNVIVFLTVPDGRLSSPVFWIGWAFAALINFVAIIGLAIWGYQKNGMQIFHLPIALTVGLGFGIVYLIVGIILMYLDINNATYPIIIELAITVVYAIAVMYFTLGGNYIAKNEEHVKSKVLYIRLLGADVEECINLTTNAEMREKLKELAEQVRFSDPMSHPSLAAIESEITLTVSNIQSELKSDSTADVTTIIDRASAQIKSRNSLCAILKQ